MFERFLIYARARRALSQGRFEAVLRLLEEPTVKGERRAGQIREKALTGLLKRSRRRLSTGNLDAAGGDVAGVLEVAPEFDGAASLSAEIEREREVLAERQHAARNLRREARDLAARGDLKAAERALGDAAEMQPDTAEQAVVERMVAGRQQAVTDDLAGAERAFVEQDLPALRHHLARLSAQSDRPDALARIQKRAVQRLAAEHVARLHAHGHDRAALDAVAADRVLCPGLVDSAGLSRILDSLAMARAASIRKDLDGGEFAAAIETFRGTHPLIAESTAVAELSAGIEALATACEARDRGDLGRALETMRFAVQSLDSKPLRQAIRELDAAAVRADQALVRARECAADGRLLAAREELVDVLEKWPMHEPLRRQIDLLDGQAKDRADRLQRARDLAADSKLAAASALLLGLAGDSQEGREARMLLKDIQGRMDLASDGVAQVRRTVHGPASSREGLRHCVARLEEIEKIQADLSEIDALRTALTAEIRGLDHLEGMRQALESGDIVRARELVAEFQTVRPAMLRADRLDARFLDFADQVLQRADAGVHNARLAEAQGWVEVVRATGQVPRALESRISQLDASIGSNQKRAEAMIAAIESSSRSGELDESAEQIEAVRAVWADCPALAKVEQRVTAMHQHTRAADEIERLTADGDVRGAERALGAMPPTPGFLRTRIFDIKQGLARAQGLEQGFLLRVDEGGEYLVLRDDSLTIGNVRDAKADVRVLANVAGVHARLERSLSFHGGMEDRIVAAKGEVFVNGRKVEAAALKAGDRVRLGPAFEFVYQLPGKRSLSAVLHLKAGFQVGGTDKILLLKDRGRDGRILIGRAPDAHIRVPHDGAEVELHGATDGQIRVRYRGSGDIGGNPFSGSHPVTAGALVRCGDTAFVLQPWQPT